MAVFLSPVGGAGAQFFDNNGNPLSGGKIYTYSAGTTSPLPTYTTNSGNVAHTNPIVLDSAGRVPSGGEIWLTLGVGYKFVVKTSAEVLIATYDNIPSSAQPPAANDADSIMYEQGYTVTAGSFVIGNMYRIATLGDTNFTLIGATANTVGLHFIATGVGSGTGTAELSQTVETKLRETISVKDFGVVGNGVVDDTAAFAAALNAITTGVSLTLCGLTIKINNQNVISSKSGFEIDGQGATIIAANGMTVASDKELLAFRSCTDFTVKNLTVNGNRANRTPAEVAAHNIELRSCQRFVFERVRSINAVVDGFILNTSTSTVASTFVREGIFIECTADNCYRQGMSIINAYNIVVSGGAFTNTTGISPQSGIDIEANAGAATPGNAYILIQGARFSGNVGRGIIASSVSTGVDIWIDGCSFDTNTDGAITAAATGTVISKCSFRGHTASVQGIVRFPASSPAVTAGIIRDCTFSGNTAAAPCIYVHAATSNVSVLDNKILDHANAGAISQFGTNTSVRGNYVSSAGGVGITVIATDPVTVNNVVSGCLNRGIYATGSTRPYIAENIVRDIISVAGGYIQSDDADAVIERNHCISATPATSTYGVYIGASSAAQSVSDNVFVNLHATNPIFVVGSGSIKKRMNNLGGAQNPGGVGLSRFLATESSTVANLPSATGAYAGARYLVTDANSTTFGSVAVGGGVNTVPVYSDGTNWRIG